jgi:acid stress-induced BolA-like protein IbaG/YrbA
MEISEIHAAIAAALPGSQIELTGEGCNFSAVVVSSEFEGLLPVKRQQKVYAAVQQWLTSGALHALSLRTYTPAELEQTRAANPAGLVQLG